MYATVSTVQIQPGQVTAFTQLWAEQIEPTINQISTLIDLYVLVNAETHTQLVVAIYASKADALACQTSPAYQQLFAQMAHMVVIESITTNEYTVIST